MNLRDPKIQKILVGFVVLVAASYVYFGTTMLPFCYAVQKEKISLLENEYSNLSAELEKARKTVGNLAHLEAEYHRLHEQWISSQELLPAESEMPDLLRKVTTAGIQAGIEFLVFEPGNPMTVDIYVEHPVKVRISGGYHQLGIFLSRLANMSRIVNISDISITSTNYAAGRRMKKLKSAGSISADFTLTAYTLLGGSDQDAEF